jgi:serine/threonine-protein kinase HipA
LMKRREAQIAKEAGTPTSNLYEIDYLLGVYDESRMGALRFKLDIDGPFLDDDNSTPTPPMSSIRELQQAAQLIESDKDNDEIKKWLAILIAPGSSLGGARPKANILDGVDLWIAKFPSQNDTIDKGAWEYLTYQLAINAGINMAESKIEKINAKHHTFFTKRFDRKQRDRVHFTSAMTMTGNNEDTIRDNAPSYLDIAEFIQYNGANITEDLHQLWRRIVFNIAVSNTDDHLRNHGFLLTEKGWVLSPAYDINPSIDKNGLALNIDMDNNALDFELAKGVGEFFKLDNRKMDNIIKEITNSVSQWQSFANKIGIARIEQEMMKGAFKMR